MLFACRVLTLSENLCFFWELPLRELPESLGELPLGELPKSYIGSYHLRKLPKPDTWRSEQVMFPSTSVLAFAHWSLVRFRTQEGRANSHDPDLLKSVKAELIILNNKNSNV